MSPSCGTGTNDEAAGCGIPRVLLESLGPLRGRPEASFAILLVGAAESSRWRVADRIKQRLLCEAESGQPPCGTCWSCRQMVAGRGHPDLRSVVEEPEQIGIDAIRALEDALTLTAHRGGWKIGWIPRANRLTEGAANAFLKTLEEPPPHTVYLLETGRPRALKATLRSRCQRWTLHVPEAAPGLWIPEWGSVVEAWVDECERMFRGEISPLAAVKERSPLTWAEQAHFWAICLWAASRARMGWSVPAGMPAALEHRLAPLSVAGIELLYTRARETERMAQAGVNQRLALESLMVGITREVHRHAEKPD